MATEQNTSMSREGELLQCTIPFKACSSIVLHGSTGTGKTYWLYRLLLNANVMFTENVHDILYCYGVWQSLFDTMEENISNLTFHEGIPSVEKLDEFLAPKQHKIIIFDDLMNSFLSNKEMEKLFTQGTHHRHVSVIYLSQNIFQAGRISKTLSNNTGYMVLFQNIRCIEQLAVLGRQIFPGKGKMFVNIFKDATKSPYSYLVLNLTPNVDMKYRMLTQIFPGEDPIIYVPHHL